MSSEFIEDDMKTTLERHEVLLDAQFRLLKQHEERLKALENPKKGS